MLIMSSHRINSYIVVFNTAHKVYNLPSTQKGDQCLSEYKMYIVHFVKRILNNAHCYVAAMLNHLSPRTDAT